MKLNISSMTVTSCRTKGKSRCAEERYFTAFKHSPPPHTPTPTPLGKPLSWLMSEVRGLQWRLCTWILGASNWQDCYMELWSIEKSIKKFYQVTVTEFNLVADPCLNKSHTRTHFCEQCFLITNSCLQSCESMRWFRQAGQKHQPPINTCSTLTCHTRSQQWHVRVLYMCWLN